MIYAIRELFICRVALGTTTSGTAQGIRTCMAEETCPERVQLVERLAHAINAKKHVEDSDSHTPADRMRVDENVNHAMEAIRSHKAEHQCKSDEDPTPSTP